MKRVFLSAFFLFLSSCLFAGIAPYSEKIGKVAVVLEEESVERLIRDALEEEFSLSWIEKYTEGDDLFLEAYSPLLSSILPLEDLLVGEYDGNGLAVLSQKNGVQLYLTIKEGKITALQKR